MMKTLTNERGIALITALLLALISLIIVLAALYFMTQQIQISAANKRYRNVLEATHGGSEVFTKNILSTLFQGYSQAKLANDFSTLAGGGNINLVMPTTSKCMSDKLNNNTAQWANCSANNKDYNPKIAYDALFTLKGMPGQPGFNIYSKIVDTQKGNSDKSGVDQLDSASGVTGSSSGVSPQHIPAVYRVEVQGERESNPLEKAALTVMYVY